MARTQGAHRAAAAASSARTTKATRAPLRLSCALLIAACTSRPRQEQPPPRPAPAAVTAPTSPRLARLAAPAPTVHALPAPELQLPFRESFTLKSPGRAPLQQVRYRWAAAERVYTLAARLRARILDDRAAQAPTPVPTFYERFAVRVAAPTASVRALQWRGEPIQIDGDGAAALPYVLRWRELLAGRRAQFELQRDQLPVVTFAEDPLRRDSRAQIDELTQRLLGLLVPLPEQPLGEGARWTVVTVLRQGTGVVKQTATYEVLALRPTGLSLQVDIRRVAEEQRLDRPDLPAGSVLDLVAMFRSITGRVELELTSPLPVSAELAIEVRAHQRLRQPDGVTTETISEDLGTLTLTSAARP